MTFVLGMFVGVAVYNTGVALGWCVSRRLRDHYDPDSDPGEVVS